MIVLCSSTCGTGSSAGSSRFLMIVLSPSSFLMIVVLSSALTAVAIGAAMIAAATLARINVRIGYLLLRYACSGNARRRVLVPQIALQSLLTESGDEVRRGPVAHCAAYPGAANRARRA